LDSAQEGWGDMDNLLVEEDAVNIANEKNQS